MNYKFEQRSIKDKPLSSHSAVKVGLFAASCRATSLNRQLVHSIDKILRAKGADTTVIDLSEYQMPLFCADDKVPSNARRLVDKLSHFEAIFIATPELNGSPPAILKNLIDWTSMLGTAHFTAPVYSIGSASPGPMSGIMAMQHLHFILARLGATVIPINVGTGNAKTAFNDDGELVVGSSLELAEAMVEQLITRVVERKRVA